MSSLYISFRTVSAGIYVLSLLLVDMMSKPSNIISPGGHSHVKKHVKVGLSS